MRGKRNVKAKLIESFKALARQKSMTKITIQEIAEGAGVIRPTFYHHFQDKYQLLEYIFREEVICPAMPLIQNDMLNEAVVLIFVKMLEEKEFYSRIYRQEGQNSFESIVKNTIYETMLVFIREHSGNKVSPHKFLSYEILAEYYSQFMGFIVIAWIGDGMNVSPREMGENFDYIKTHSLYEIIREME